MNTLTFTEAKGKWLSYTDTNVRCDREEQLNHWLQVKVKDGEIFYHEKSNTYKVISEEARKSQELHERCMQNWINDGCSLD